MTTCQKCATVIEEGDAYCPGCGRRVAWERMETTQQTITPDDARRIAQAHTLEQGNLVLATVAAFIVACAVWGIVIFTTTLTPASFWITLIVSVIIFCVVAVKTMDALKGNVPS